MSISLTNLMFASLGLYIFFRFVIFPFSFKIAEKDKSISALKKIILRNIVDFCGLFFLLTTISSMASYIIVKIVNLKGGSNLEDVKLALESARFYESIISGLSNDWSYTTTFILAISLIILAYKASKDSFQDKLNQNVNKKFKELEKEYDDGRLEYLPPNDEMKHVKHQIDECLAKIEEIENKSSENSNSELESLKEMKHALSIYLKKLDIVRRINISIEDDTSLKPESTKDKVLTFFVSQGLLNSFRKGSAILFTIGLLLLIPSLLCLSSTTIQKNINEKVKSLNLEIEHLELSLQTNRIENEFHQYFQLNKNENTDTNGNATIDVPISTDDEQALNEISKTFENNILLIRASRGLYKINQTYVNKLTSHCVKESILDTFSSTDKNVKVHKNKKLTAFENEAIVLERKAIKSKGPVTTIGKRFKADLKTYAYNNKKVWSRYKKGVSNATRSFQIPATPRNIKGLMLSNIVGHAAKGIEIPGTIGKIYGNVTNIPSNIAEQFYIDESRRYMLALAKSENLQGAIDEIGRVKSKAIPAIQSEKIKLFVQKNSFPEKLPKSIQENPPSLSRMSKSNMAKAEQTISRIAKLNNVTNANRLADSMSTFGDFFPGYHGEERYTPRGKTNFATHQTKTFKSATHSFSRARSYVRLRGFSRIGGVLIGRMPDGASSLDIIDINWKVQDKYFTISLTKRNNKREELGTFNPAIIYLSLAYASDGRVTTVTMVTSKPLFDLKILLHPTLVDTPLGCRAIRLDQIADETTSMYDSLRKLREQENNIIDSTQTLYKFSWAKRLQLINSIYLQNSDIDLSDYFSYAERIISNNSKKIQEIIDSKQYCFEFLEKNTNYYDIKLVNAIKKCIPSEDFSKCISSNISSKFSESFFILPPETTEWSGVRERKYLLDDNLNFIKLDKNDSLWPFRFMVQSVFTSEPEFSAQENSDAPPWEFENVNKLLMKRIFTRINSEPELTSLISDMREFAVLQRLFRLALDGYLGTNFPIDKLALLAKQTKQYHKEYRTLRWLPKPDQLETVAKLQIIFADEIERKSIEENLKLNLQLRSELGIEVDENQIKVEGNCPEP